MKMAKVGMFSSKVKPFDARTTKPLPKQADPELQTAEHQRLRAEACDRAGWRCQWIEYGKRCESSKETGHTMVGDHIKERADGGDPFDARNYQCLCSRHNTIKGILARKARAQSSFKRD